jgi:tRNA U55 pseudouridine synthase TruB
MMQVSEELPWEHIDEQDIRSAVEKSFLGDIMQVPPMYSAIKVRLGCLTHRNWHLPVYY